MVRQDKKKHSTRLISYTFLLVNTLVWGAAFVIVKPSLEFTTPFRFLFYRYLLAVIFSAPIFFFYLNKYWGKLLQIKIKQIILLETIGNGFALAVLYSGLKLTSALEANLLTTVMPIFVIVGGIIFLKEKQEKHEWFGLALAFFGTIILTLAPIFSINGQFTQFSLWGNILIIIHNLSNMIYFPFAKKVYQGIPKLFITSISFYISLLFFTVLSLFELETASILSLAQTSIAELSQPSVIWAAFYMAFFGSIIGLTAYIKGQDGIESSEASFFWYLQPLVYIPLSFLLLNERINLAQLFSLVIIFAGVYIAERRQRRTKKSLAKSR